MQRTTTQQENERPRTNGGGKAPSTSELEKIVFHGGDLDGRNISEINDAIERLDRKQTEIRENILSEYTSQEFQPVFEFLDKVGLYDAENFLYRQLDQMREGSQELEDKARQVDHRLENLIDEIQESEDKVTSADSLMDDYETTLKHLSQREEQLRSQYREDKKRAFEERGDLSYRETREELKDVKQKKREVKQKLDEVKSIYVREDKASQMLAQKIAVERNRRNILRDCYHKNQERIRVAEIALNNGVSSMDIMQAVKGTRVDWQNLEEHVEEVLEGELESGKLPTLNGGQPLYQNGQEGNTVMDELAEQGRKHEEYLDQRVDEIRERRRMEGGPGYEV